MGAVDPGGGRGARKYILFDHASSLHREEGPEGKGLAQSPQLGGGSPSEHKPGSVASWGSLRGGKDRILQVPQAWGEFWPCPSTRDRHKDGPAFAALTQWRAL